MKRRRYVQIAVMVAIIVVTLYRAFFPEAGA